MEWKYKQRLKIVRNFIFQGLGFNVNARYLIDWFDWFVMYQSIVYPFRHSPNVYQEAHFLLCRRYSLNNPQGLLTVHFPTGMTHCSLRLLPPEKMLVFARSFRKQRHFPKLFCIIDYDCQGRA